MSRMPRLSTFKFCPWLSTSLVSASGVRTSAIGILIQKMADQCSVSEIAPPRTGPQSGASPVMLPKIPSALPRLSAG